MGYFLVAYMNACKGYLKLICVCMRVYSATIIFSFFLFFKQGATHTGNKDIFLNIHVHRKKVSRK